MSDIHDLLLTDSASGRKMLVNAFDIATVQDLGRTREIVLKNVFVGTTVPEATPQPYSQYFASPVFTVRVAETLEQIAAMRTTVANAGSMSYREPIEPPKA